MKHFSSRRLPYLLMVFCLTAVVNGMCRGGELYSAYNVTVDLSIPTSLSSDSSGASVDCSVKEEGILGDLIERGIQAAASRIAEWSLRWRNSDGAASICKIPEEIYDTSNNNRNRRLDNHFGIKDKVDAGFMGASRRLSYQEVKFRYQGGMRCRLCFPDTFDGGYTPDVRGPSEELKFDALSQSMKCHKYDTKRVHFPRNIFADGQRKRGYLSNAEGTNITFQIDDIMQLTEYLVLDFDLRAKNAQTWSGQHIVISINDNLVDLGAFYSDNEDEGTRNGETPVVGTTDQIEWTLKSRNSTGQDVQIHTVILIVPRFLYSKKGSNVIDFGVSFGDEENPHIGKISPLYRRYVSSGPANECSPHARVVSSKATGQRYLSLFQRVGETRTTRSSVFGPDRSTTGGGIQGLSGSKEKQQGRVLSRRWDGSRKIRRRPKHRRTRRPKHRRDRRPKHHRRPKYKKVPVTIAVSPSSPVSSPTQAAADDSSPSAPTTLLAPTTTEQTSGGQPLPSGADIATAKDSRLVIMPPGQGRGIQTPTADATRNATAESRNATATATANSTEITPTPSPTPNPSTKHFRYRKYTFIIRSILTTSLRDLLKTRDDLPDFGPGHCMHGKALEPIVALAPKPEWEKNLPTCIDSSNNE